MRPANRIVKDQSDSCMMISKHIVQMEEDFDLMVYKNWRKHYKHIEYPDF
jgi:hypothetical protein